MSALVVTAPLVVAKTQDGGLAYLYRGAAVPPLAAGESKRLREGGFIEVVEDPAPAEPVGPPARSAGREPWAAYALTLGATEADLDGKSRDYIRDLCDLHASSK